jgi:hypothetical protein
LNKGETSWFSALKKEKQRSWRHLHTLHDEVRRRVEVDLHQLKMFPL